MANKETAGSRVAVLEKLNRSRVHQNLAHYCSCAHERSSPCALLTCPSAFAFWAFRWRRPYRNRPSRYGYLSCITYPPHKFGWLVGRVSLGLSCYSLDATTPLPALVQNLSLLSSCLSHFCRDSFDLRAKDQLALLARWLAGCFLGTGNHGTIPSARSV